MSYGRSNALAGEEIILRSVLVDSTGELINADSMPDLYIYDSSVDIETIEEEIEDETFASALVGPLTPTLITLGFYEYTYTIPSGGDAGTWRDVWVAEVNGVSATQYLDFEVVVGAEFESQSIGKNQLIIVELEVEILDVDGNALDETQISFSTVYEPFYASPDLIRLELGPLIDYISDDALALMIHWASKEADFLAKPHKCNQKDFEFARTKFVIYATALRAIMFPSVNKGGLRKQLGDLSIVNGAMGSTVAVLSSGIDMETFRELKRLKEEWSRVVNAGGCIVPGQSIQSATGSRSRFDEGRRNAGRLWEPSEQFSYQQPTVNTKRKTNRSNNRRFIFDPTGPGRR
jgi:hypothetical protein